MVRKNKKAKSDEKIAPRLKHDIDPESDAVVDAFFRQSVSRFGWEMVFYRRTHSGKEFILNMPVKFDSANWIPFRGDLPARGKLEIPWKFGERLIGHFKKSEEQWKDKCLALEAHLQDMRRCLDILMNTKKSDAGVSLEFHRP